MDAARHRGGIAGLAADRATANGAAASATAFDIDQSGQARWPGASRRRLCAAPVPGVDARPPATETPARAPEPAPAPPAPTETAPQQPAPATAVAERQPEPPKREPKAEARTASGSRPVAGQTYLQLAATTQHEADIMVDVLRKKSFRAMAAEIEEKPGTFRVLVGPITDSTANKMRADLQGAGFPGNAAIRRTF